MIFTDEVKFCVKYLMKRGMTPETIKECMLLGGDIDADFELVKVQMNDFQALAVKMRELWPAGEKDGKWPWRDSVDNIAKRLEIVWTDRFKGKELDIDECLTVAKRYLARFQSNTKYMKVLKYFIYKKKPIVQTSDGRIRNLYESEFADMLEGKKCEDEVQNEWDSLINDSNLGEGTLV